MLRTTIAPLVWRGDGEGKEVPSRPPNGPGALWRTVVCAGTLRSIVPDTPGRKQRETAP
jgi:hypothetical protein